MSRSDVCCVAFCNALLTYLQMEWNGMDAYQMGIICYLCT